MFDQTFVDGTQKTRKPAAVAFSIALQIVALCILILIPLVYTEGLPSAQLKNLLVAPLPPQVPVHTTPPTRTMQPKQVFRPLNPKLLIAPIVIPKRINPVEEAMPAPDIVGLVGVPDSSGSNAIPFGSATELAPAPAPKEKSPAASGPIRVGSFSEANLIRRIQPVYPPLAKSARIQGMVEFTAVISKERNIEHLQLVRGHPLLVNAAQDAVLQWKYRPTLLNGQPVEVITDIIVNFTLTQ